MCPTEYYNMITADNPKEILREKMVAFAQAHNITQAAQAFDTTRKTVRKWLRRKEAGEPLTDRSRRPDSCPSKTEEETADMVAQARKNTQYGPHRLSDWLRRTEGLEISPWTIRNILERRDLLQQQTERSNCYPAHWVWEQDGENPFNLVQADVKDVHDKATLGTERTTHLSRAGLPRYQWTFLEGQSRLRFLAYSHRVTRDCGTAFLSICLHWLRQAGIDIPVQIQTDWGQEFGGDNPERIDQVNRRHFAPLNAELCRYPLGRKGYNGRVERSHRSDDEEFYMPLLLDIEDTNQYLDRAFRWQAFYNLFRPHYGSGMDGKTPIEKLRAQGLKVSDSFALPPPIVLDPIASQIVAQSGYDVQANYTQTFIDISQCCPTP